MGEKREKNGESTGAEGGECLWASTQKAEAKGQLQAEDQPGLPSENWDSQDYIS